jgi:carboxypeptidase C (cathepsin A)
MFFNDTITAYSLNIALQNFFKVFNEYLNNDFYITGISYAGIYIPYLVKEIINNDDSKINLKGILIGNPYTHEETDYEDSIVEFSFTHGLISYPTFKKYLTHCPHLPQKEQIIKGDFENNVEYKKYYYHDMVPMKNVTKKCNEVRTEIHEQMHGINFYGIHNECPADDEINKYRDIFKNINFDEVKKFSSRQKYLEIIENNYFKKNIIEQGFGIDDWSKINFNEELEKAKEYISDCGFSAIELFVTNFLNDKETKRKLGVNEEITYNECTDLFYKFGDSLDFYKNDLEELSKKGFKAWLFSGTEDIIV